jgi:dUTPase
VVAPVLRAQIVAVEALSETARGSGGFGSTGAAQNSTTPG